MLLRRVERVAGPRNRRRKAGVDQRGEQAHAPIEHARADEPDERDGERAEKQRGKVIRKLGAAEDQRREGERVRNQLVGRQQAVIAAARRVWIAVRQDAVRVADHRHLVRAQRHRVEVARAEPKSEQHHRDESGELPGLRTLAQRLTRHRWPAGNQHESMAREQQRPRSEDDARRETPVAGETHVVRKQPEQQQHRGRRHVQRGAHAVRLFERPAFRAGTPSRKAQPQNHDDRLDDQDCEQPAAEHAQPVILWRTGVRGRLRQRSPRTHSTRPQNDRRATRRHGARILAHLPCGIRAERRQRTIGQGRESIGQHRRRAAFTTHVNTDRVHARAGPARDIVGQQRRCSRRQPHIERRERQRCVFGALRGERQIG